MAVSAVIDVARGRDDQRPSLADLDSLVAEVGVSYPLLAYTSLAGEDASEREQSEALDSVILAGLVSP